MRAKKTDLIEFNCHLSTDLSTQVKKLQDAGLSLSAIARLAIRKCCDLPLDEEGSDDAYPKRVILYLKPEDARLLGELAVRDGDRSRARNLRRLIATYLRINAAAVDDLF